jgi:hypothetical protein
MPQTCDMRQTALLPLRRKACWGFFRPKNPTASAGFKPRTWVPEASMLTTKPPTPSKIGRTTNRCKGNTQIKKITQLRNMCHQSPDKRTMLWSKIILEIMYTCVTYFVKKYINLQTYMAERGKSTSKEWFCSRWLPEIAGSNPAGSMDICLLWMWCFVPEEAFVTGRSPVLSSPTESVFRSMWSGATFMPYTHDE